MGCEECARGSGGKPNCNVCARPILDDENADVWQLWNILQGSPNVVGMGSYLGADLRLADMFMNYYEVPNEERLYWMARLMALNHIAQKYHSKKD